MKLFRNVIDDAIEYNKHIAKYNEKNEFVKLAPIKEEKVITITLDEYKELLVYKGKYLGLTGINEITKLYADGIEVYEKKEDNHEFVDKKSE
jgi:hypothetical protein|nr:MAG TPA: hypothetical protein [Caudoviricetes sp.]